MVSGIFLEGMVTASPFLFLDSSIGYLPRDYSAGMGNQVKAGGKIAPGRLPLPRQPRLPDKSPGTVPVLPGDKKYCAHPGWLPPGRRRVEPSGAAK